MLEENKALVRRMIEEVQNQRNVEAMDEFFSPDYTDHGAHPPDFTPTLAGSKRLHANFFAAFPDLHATIQLQVAEGDMVVTHKTFHGTHQGEFLGVAATGKQVNLEVIDILRVAGGKLTDHWAVLDLLGMMRQLGVAPGTGQ